MGANREIGARSKRRIGAMLPVGCAALLCSPIVVRRVCAAQTSPQSVINAKSLSRSIKHFAQRGT